MRDTLEREREKETDTDRQTETERRWQTIFSHDTPAYYDTSQPGELQKKKGAFQKLFSGQNLDMQTDGRACPVYPPPNFITRGITKTETEYV